MGLDHAVGMEHGGVALTELDRHVAQVDIGEGAEQRTHSPAPIPPLRRLS